jgi:hypothetical protein
MNENLIAVKRIVLGLRREIGNVIEVDEIIRMGADEDIPKKDVITAIKSLEGDGMVKFLDSSTIEVTG